MERKLFLGANTPDGFVGYFDKIIEMYNLKKLYILKGGSGVGKSTFIKKFAEVFLAKDKTLDVNYFYCSADPNSLDGAIIENLNVGIIDGTAPHITDPHYPGLIDEIIDLSQFIDPKKLACTREQIDEITAAKRKHYYNATAHLSKAREQHMQLEALYKPAVDFKRIDELLARLIIIP